MRLSFRLPTALRSLGLLPILAVTLLAAQFIPVPLGSVRWHGAQTLAVETGTVFMIAALLVNLRYREFEQNWLLLVQFPPLSCLFLLLIWGTISCATAADKPFALQGFLQLFLGMFVVFLTASQVRTQAQLTFALDALLTTAFLVALSGFALFGGEGLTIAVGVLHDHMLFGAFLMLLLPICLAAGVSPLPLNRRLFAQAACLACQAALLAAQTRSAWIGEAFALSVFGLLAWMSRPAASPAHGSPGGPRSFVRQSVSAAAVLFVCAGALFWMLPDRDAFLARIQTLTTTVTQGKDTSTQWRFAAWSGAERMIREKPVQGWGIGCYAPRQFSFTQIGRTAAQVGSRGPTILDETHNSYLQLWAEIGIVGLLLWLAALVSFLAAGVWALRRYPARSPAQWALIGCLSALAGQMVDALANPAWQFANVALPLWIVLGLIAALARPAAAAETPRREKRLQKLVLLPQRLGQAVLAAGVGGALLWLMYRTAFALPAPHL